MTKGSLYVQELFVNSDSQGGAGWRPACETFHDGLDSADYGRRVSERSEDAPTPVDPRIAAAVVDVFVYVVVLNLFVEYLPRVLSETFTLSLLTAVLLKVVLEVVVAAKKRVVTRFRQAATPTGKVVAAFLVWAVVFGSKFLVLEAVAP